MFPNLSDQLFSCNGFQGQRVFIFPEKRLVVVRMGLSEDWNIEELLLRILKVIPVEPTPDQAK